LNIKSLPKQQQLQHESKNSRISRASNLVTKTKVATYFIPALFYYRLSNRRPDKKQLMILSYLMLFYQSITDIYLKYLFLTMAYLQLNDIKIWGLPTFFLYEWCFRIKLLFDYRRSTFILPYRRSTRKSMWAEQILTCWFQG